MASGCRYIYFGAYLKQNLGNIVCGFYCLLAGRLVLLPGSGSDPPNAGQLRFLGIDIQSQP